MLIAIATRFNQYFLLSLFLLVLMIFHTCNGTWCGDFWMHCDVVRELATHPLCSRHPEFLLNAPHAFYSPYSLALAWIVRIFNSNPIRVLSIAGIFNFVLFVVGLERFVSLLLGKGRGALYTLFFMLFLWGFNPWFYSGFFHFKVIAYVLPYPSTLAMALTFFALSMSILYLRKRSKWMLCFLLLFSVVILLSHPLSAIVLFVGILALVISHKNQQGVPATIDRFLLLLIIPLSFLIALLWPYYSLLKLILSQGAFLDVENRCMYQGVLRIIFPSLIGLVILILRMKSNWKDPLVLIFLGLLIVYIYGGMSGHFSYGRVISSIVLILQISIADWMCKNENFKTLTLKSKCVFILVVGLSLFGLVNNCNAKCRHYLPGLNNSYDRYQFLTQYTKQYDVILSDPETSFLIPTFGGKVVANGHLLPFVQDGQKREDDLDSFFNRKTSQILRFGIINRYHVDFILINKEESISEGLSSSDLSSLGRQVYLDKDFILIKINHKIGSHD